jgi:DNA ligase-1
MNIELLEQIEAIGSRLEKERLLKTLDTELQGFVRDALDPDITYGVTVDEDEWLGRYRAAKKVGAWPTNTREPFWGRFGALLKSLQVRNLTGNTALSAMDLVLRDAPDEVALKWACRFINRQMRAGFDIRTYNVVFGKGTVQKFEVQLADTYEGQDLRGLWFFQPKLDGNRVVFIDGRAMSRNGKEYPNCEFVAEEIERKHGKEFWDEWVVDGEMMGDLGFDQSSGALRRIHQKDRKKATFTYWAFDLVSRQEWNERRTRTLFHRDIDLRRMLGGMEKVVLVPTTRIHDPSHEQVMQLCHDFVSLGFEGAMAKEADRPYVFKRGDNILKVKLFKDVDARIVDFYEGKGRHKGRLGGIIIETDDAIRSKCGSGFDDPTRDIIWRNKKGWMGATVQVQYFEKTKDGSLRFPVFIMRRKDKE